MLRDGKYQVHTVGNSAERDYYKAKNSETLPMSDVTFNKLGHHRLCSQPTCTPAAVATANPAQGTPAPPPSAARHKSCSPLSLWPWSHSYRPVSIMCRVAAGSHLLFSGTILQCACTVPHKVPAGFNLLVILVARLMARPWIASLSQSLFLFPGTTSKKKEKSISPLLSRGNPG